MSEGATCCPLSSCDEAATVFSVSMRTARKEHKCEECSQIIPVRARHEYISMMYDGGWSSFRLCLLCSEIGNHFACGNGRVVGTLWDDLRENFFPDMKAGGPCMAGLSPAAKQWLIDERMKWYFDQREINDDRWEDWKPPTTEGSS